jgi:hypothetical protein
MATRPERKQQPRITQMARMKESIQKLASQESSDGGQDGRPATGIRFIRVIRG